MYCIRKLTKKDDTEQYIVKNESDTQKKDAIDNTHTDNKIRYDNNRTENRIKEDNNKTDNKIRLAQAKSDIKNAERRKLHAMDSAPHGETGVKSSEPLKDWISMFQSKYSMPKYANIPILKDILNGCSYGIRDAMFFTLLSSCGAVCFSKTRARFLDGKMHSPSIFVIVEGESGSGKGHINNVYKDVFKNVIELDRKKFSTNVANCIIQTAGINVSYSKFVDILAHNQGVHIYAMETEIANVKEIFRKKGSLKMADLRSAFDNDPVYRYNSSKGTQGSFPIFLNCTFMGTPKAIERFFNEDEVEGGTARRFCFTAIPELYLNESNTIALPCEQALEDIRAQISEWQNNYSFTNDPDNGDIACGEHIVDLTYVNNALRGWLKDQGTQYEKDKHTERQKLGNSIACIAFRCAMVLHMMAGDPGKDQKNKRDTVKKLTIYIANYCMERFIAKLGNPVNEAMQPSEIPDLCQSKRKLTDEEVEYWYSLRGTKDEFGNVIVYKTIAKKLGIGDHNVVRNAFVRYQKKKNKA